MKDNILVVEDNYTNFLFIKILLQNRFTLDWAKDGEEALRFYEKGTYCLILMDYQIPKYTGTEVTTIIRKTNKNIPIIAQTGYDIQESNLRKAGCNEVLIKPIRKKELFETIQKYLPEINFTT